MTQKTNNAYLIALTLLLALAGTGLTLVNNLDLNNWQMSAIALALATCFSAAEIVFIWGHKVFESVTKRWRRIVIGVSLFALICAMSAAVYQELNYAFEKQRRIVQTSFANQLLETSLDKAKNERERTRARREISRDNKIDIKMPISFPFMLCYAMAGTVGLIITACNERKRNRSGGGNVIATPLIIEKAQAKFGFTPTQAYRDSKDNGYALWKESKYVGFISDKEIQ